MNEKLYLIMHPKEVTFLSHYQPREWQILPSAFTSSFEACQDIVDNELANYYDDTFVIASYDYAVQVALREPFSTPIFTYSIDCIDTLEWSASCLGDALEDEAMDTLKKWLSDEETIALINRANITTKITVSNNQFIVCLSN